MINKIFSPFLRFDKTQSLSGFLLFGATILALVWANSPFGQSYHDLWQTELGFTSERINLVKPLILWVNDGLMAIFFFLIGLEIKRELSIGELNTLRKASLPIFGAVGGMVFPVVLFFLLNRNPETMRGWGIPMATDIAFTLAILKLLGNRVPIGLKVFLTAFAIIDDIGAVLVIALFYSSGIKADLLAIAGLLLVILFILSARGMYAKYIIVLFGGIIWYLFLKSGIHPTVAGVLVAFAVPIRQRIDIQTYTEKLDEITREIEGALNLERPILSDEQISHISDLEDWTRKVQSPLQHLEQKLHDIVAYFIMPVFALANAGVVLGKDIHMDGGLILALAVSLIAGKFIGVFLLSMLGIRLKLADLPEGVNMRQIGAVAVLSGVGFTMSLFIAGLAFTGHPASMDSAKLGILAGSMVAGAAGYLAIRWSTKEQS